MKLQQTECGQGFNCFTMTGFSYGNCPNRSNCGLSQQISLAACQTEPPYYGLNSQALSVIILAQRESLRTNQDFVGTEQLLLGLIREGTGVAAKVLNFSGVTLKDTRIETEKNIGRQGSGFPAVCNFIVITLSSLCFLTPFFRNSPLSPQAKRILELSIEEALQMGHNSIGTEHLLL